MRKSLILIVFFLLAGCGGLSSEPAIVSTAPLPTVTPTPPPDIGHPVQPVNLAEGAAIFNGAQGCQNCHGSNGQGNGPVAASFACKIPNAADPGVARSAAVTDWFTVASNGNGGDTSCLMPPWKSQLTEQQRWNVTSYLYSLHYTPDTLAAGASVWTTNCTACHGERGAGDGPKAKTSPRPVPNFTDPSYLITHSDTDLYNSVTHGIGSIMPAFANKLDDNARWSVVAYLRALSWGGSSALPAAISTANATPFATPFATPDGTTTDATAPATMPATAPATLAATSAPIPDAPTVTITGKIANGTPGGSVPANLPLILRIIDTSSGATHDTGTVNVTASGDTFAFKDVPRRIGQVYVVTTQYENVQQFSTPIKLAPGIGPTLDVPLPIYEVSGDATDVVITQQTLILDFPSAANTLIEEGVNFQNNGKHIYLSTQKAPNGDPLSLQLPLPTGAEHVTLDASVQAQFGVDSGSTSTIQSTLPMFPGETRPVQFSFSLPFDQQVTFTQPTLYPVQAISVYLPDPSGFVINDAKYAPAQPIVLQDATLQNVTYHGYTLANPPLPGGTPIQFVAASQGILINNDATLRRNTLAVVLTLALLVFALIGLAVWRLGRTDQAALVADPLPVDTLAQQIADLDDRYAAGAVSQAEYSAQRPRLKTQLVKLLGG